MARGFDSKSVSDQQEELQRRRDAQGTQKVVLSPRRRQLEMARIDLLRRLEAAPEPHKERLRLALAALDEELKKETAGGEPG